MIKSYKALAALHRKRGEPERALEVLERALDVQDEVGRSLTYDVGTDRSGE